MRLLGLVAVLVALWLVLKRMGQGATPASPNAPLGSPALTPPAPLDTPVDEYNPGQAQQDNPINELSQAIYQWESGGKQDSLAVQNNNPGNLKNTAGSFQQFGDFSQGWASLQGYITRHAQQHSDWDFYDFFNYYLRGSTTAAPNDTQGSSDAYAEYAASYLGVDPTQTVASALGIGS